MPMSAHRDPAPSPKSDVLEARAADWIARRNGGLDPAAQTELAAWLVADTRHAEAFAAMERAWDSLNAPRLVARPESARWIDFETRRRVRSRRYRQAWSAFGVAAALALGFFFRPSPNAVPAVATVRTEARPTIRTLPDGSKVALRPGAAIEVAFDTSRRAVRLTRGEALFTVAKDAARPFVVSARNVAVRAVGTEFFVRHDPSAIEILVTEGRITVSSAAAVDPAPALNVAAGERVVVPTEASSPRSPQVVAAPAAEIARSLAWRGRRLEFSDLPLADALALLNRDGQLTFELAAPALGRRTITAVIWADDTESFVRLLETGFDLVAERNGSVVRLRAR
jgi:transmembrane sensor